MTRLLLSFSLFIHPLISSGCQDSTLRESGSTVRDSAGITITESSVPLWEGAEPWRLSADPILQSGVQDGGSLYQLFSVMDGERLRDGRIAIVNSGSNAIRFYDSEGLFAGEIGGRGEGLGEFQSLSSLAGYRGDSLWAYDRP